MDIVLGFIDIARIIGSFLCFQWKEATFKVDGKYFPVCSGCFGIYLGSLIALSCFPFFEKWSRRLYSVKHGGPMLLPMVTYWTILYIERNTGTWIIPGIKEIYGFTGILLGATISNAAYNLSFETSYKDIISKIGRKFWILTLLLPFTSLVVFFLYPVETAILFVASLIFILGLFGLVGFIATWIIASVFQIFKGKNSASIKALTSILTVLAVFIGFLFFQVLIFESKWKLVFLGLLFGAFSFGLFGYSLRTFTLEELGIVKKDWKRQIVYGILVGGILFVAFVVYRFISSGFQELIFLQPQIDYVGVPFILAIVISEEFFFRGYLIPMLQRQINTTVSCITASIFFSVYHQSAVIKSLIGVFSMNFYWNYEYTLIQFAGGLLLSFLFVKKRSLIMPITVHFTWNLLVLA